ncbi:bifunctional DNA primase/polymerase [Corynebacterium sp. AOP12-C2-36]|uniref:bifunctional DNA primase/polymerase n=1 Tax=Corynebacterium sp. AOP12-C2-36 TaxID=3457723 RepID=UPI004034ED8D
MDTTSGDNAAARLTDLLRATTGDTLTTTAEHARAFIRPLLDAGCPLLPLRTDTGNQKAPVYPGGFNAASTDHDTWDRWLDELYTTDRGPGTPAMGLGMRVGTNAVVIDVDDPDEHAAFTEFCAHIGLGDPGVPTVTTPGSTDASGAVKHHSGGHWWFATVPGDIPARLNKTIRIDAAGRTDADIPTDEVTDPATGTVTRTAAPSFALMLSTGFVAIPPTQRDEGLYRLAGPVNSVPENLRTYLRELEVSRGNAESEALRERIARRSRPRTDQQEALDEAIDAWGDQHSWADILMPQGWEITGHDRCGCEQWRRPGASSTKSATAHDCTVGTYLKVWTDNAGAYGLTKDGTYSKMQLNAAMNHAGDTRAALTGAGITSGLTKIDTGMFDLRERIRAINEQQAAAAGVDVNDPDLPEVPYDEAAYPLGHPNNPRLVERIFDFNDVTRAIYHSARSRPVYTSPMTLLFSELIRAGRTSSHGSHTELDDQLSMFVALCARSGGGKSVAMSMMQRPSIFLRGGLSHRNREATTPAGDLVVGGLASGQAMIDGLAEEVIKPGDDEGSRPEKVLAMRSPAVLTIIEDELDNLAAKSQSGSTLSNTVLSAWSCGTIGDLSRTHGMRMINGVDDPYTVYLVGGIQPARASTMVGRAAVSSGLAQRVFFIATEDPWFDDPQLGSPRPDAAVVASPQAGGMLEWDDGKKQFCLPAVPNSTAVEFCPEMRHAMRLQNLHTARGDQDPRDTHLTRVRFRLACLMALHSGQRKVTPEVWEWTSALMEHRRLAFAFVEEGAEAAAQEEADEQSVQRRRADAASADQIANETAEVASALLAKLPPEGMTRSPWRKNMAKRRRRFFDAAVAELESSGQVVRAATERGGVRYFRAP